MHTLASEETEAHPYSLVRTVDARTAWVSGVLPYRPDGALEHLPEAAIAAALRVLGERLADAGATIGDVVKVTVFLTDLGWRDALDDAWRRTWRPPRPARTAVEVRALPRGAAIELDAVAQVELH
jgi:2-iminobutanoate/2-iminopropanoate deaminase